MRIATPIFCLLLSLCSCQTTPVTDAGREASARPFYSEAHLPLAKWNRKADCCSATGKEAAVSSGGTHSSRIGLEVLNEGGNAVDAAVAISFALCVERPHSLGIGGGGFMTLHLKEEAPADYFVDFRETAPAKASRNMYLDGSGNIIPDKSTEGGLAVATPGMVAGLYDIHKKWGRLPWRKVVGPAIQLAREGFPAYISLAERTQKGEDWISKNAEARKILWPERKPLAVGQTFKQPDLAKTLTLIAKHGKTAFYRGTLAQKIVASVASHGGVLQASDLKQYTVKFREPVRGTFRDLTFTSAPPPSAGGVLLAQMLGVLDGFKLEQQVFSTSQYVHLLSEVMKRGYADRSDFIGDPDFVTTPWPSLSSMQYIESVRKKINQEKATPSAQIRPGAELKPEIHGTSHLSLLDSEGNAVAGTLTINDSFGAKLVVPGTGIFLNNEMDDFSAKPGTPNIYGLTGSDANAIAPGKRPVSSMSPTLVFRSGEAVMAVGGAGGSRIISSVLQTILNATVAYPNDIARSVFAPRAHHQWLPDRLDLEVYPDNVVTELKQRGHEIGPWPWAANVFAVHKDPSGVFTAAFDPRDEGGVAAQ